METTFCQELSMVWMFLEVLFVTGGAMGDLSGYTLTLTGMEKAPANFMESDPTTVGFTVVNS